MKIPFSNEEEEKLLRELYESQPEASRGFALVCISYDYSKFRFTFIDTEDNDKKYILTLKKTRQGLRQAMADMMREEISLDLYTGDSFDLDKITQYALLGKLIYG